MVQKHVAFAPEKMGTKKWGQAPFCKKEDILNLWTEHQKMGPVPIFYCPITDLEMLLMIRAFLF
jgi:hypothetical protein